MNNYERIKQMSVEDMAKILKEFKCSHCLLGEMTCEKRNKGTQPDCIYSIKQWLLSEVEDDN